jgi:hypothetical protein
MLNCPQQGGEMMNSVSVIDRLAILDKKRLAGEITSAEIDEHNQLMTDHDIFDPKEYIAAKSALPIPDKGTHFYLAIKAAMRADPDEIVPPMITRKTSDKL